MTPAPESFDKFMNALQEYDISEFDEALAHQLRIHASSRFFGTIMTCGPSALPYMPWLVDGMNMSNKLIVQLDNSEEALYQTVKELIDSDIRLTCHCQDQQAFTADITEHRIDILLLTEDALPNFENWINLLSETGMIILVANAKIRESKMQKYLDDYFCMDNGHLFIAQKGNQHKKTRTRGKRRRASNVT